jgi:hypothetical protein
MATSRVGSLSACCVCDVPAVPAAAHKACGRKIMLPLQIQFREAAAPEARSCFQDLFEANIYTRRVSPVDSDSIICCALSLLTHSLLTTTANEKDAG